MKNFLHFVTVNKSKSILVFLFFIFVIALILKISLPNNLCGKYDEKIIKISEKEIVVQIADQDCKRTQGLSGRKYLKEDEGMLFVFEKNGSHEFWMKGMNFPIDILWLDNDFKIIGIEKMLSPDTFPKVYGKNFVSKYVLELNGGVVEKNNIKVGNFISIYEK